MSQTSYAARFGQGALLVGSHAVAAGLADAIGTFGAPTGAQSTHTGATKMQETHGVTSEGPKPTDDLQTVEAWAVEEWDRNPAVRQEFTSRETFVAYTKAAHAGRARVLGSRTVRR